MSRRRCCCTPTIPCDACPSGQAHVEYQVVIAGVAAKLGGCTLGVAPPNGTYIVSQFADMGDNATSCTWRYCGEQPCNAGDPFAPVLYVAFSIVASVLKVTLQICIYAGSYICDGPVTTDTCDGLVVTWQDTPDPLTCDFTAKPLTLQALPTGYTQNLFDFTVATCLVTAL